MIAEDQILNQANIFLGAKDRHFKYIYCNERVAEGLGLDSPQQIVGKTDYDLFDESLADIYRAGDIRVMEGGVFINEKEYQTQVDSVIDVLTSKNKLMKPDGSSLGVVVSYINITCATQKIHFDEKTNSYVLQVSDSKIALRKKEYKILQHLMLGLTNNTIAKKVHLSPRTVEEYVTQLRIKFACEHKHQIIETVMRLGVAHQLIDLN